MDKIQMLLGRMRTDRSTWPIIGVMSILLVIPFHATLTVWTAQLLGHYMALRLWKEVLLALLTLSAIYRVWRDAAIRHKVLRFRLFWGIAVYACVQIVWGLVSYRMHGVTGIALGYGLLIDLRFLLFFIDVWILAAGSPRLSTLWPKLVFWPLAVVVLIGLLQYFVLPYDFLRHLGYNKATIFPYQDINHNIHYIRIMSTLRGANPLGAYLVAMLALVLARRETRRIWWWMLTGGSLLALLLSFSRGAWLGCIFTVAIVVAALLPWRRLRVVLIGAGIATACVGATLLLARGNVVLQNVVLHTQDHSAVRTTSNAGHLSALQNGLRDVVREPLGRGPGTAGPASAYNSGHRLRIAEDYFIQIAQEVGWLGIVLFCLVYVWVACALWRQRHTALALGLFAGMIGVSVAGLFSHVWTDDTLAYLWWGLAGIALAPPVGSVKTEVP